MTTILAFQRSFEFLQVSTFEPDMHPDFDTTLYNDSRYLNWDLGSGILNLTFNGQDLHPLDTVRAFRK